MKTFALSAIVVAASAADILAEFNTSEDCKAIRNYSENTGIYFDPATSYGSAPSAIATEYTAYGPNSGGFPFQFVKRGICIASGAEELGNRIYVEIDGVRKFVYLTVTSAGAIVGHISTSWLSAAEEGALDISVYDHTIQLHHSGAFVIQDGSNAVIAHTLITEKVFDDSTGIYCTGQKAAYTKVNYDHQSDDGTWAISTVYSTSNGSIGNTWVPHLYYDYLAGTKFSGKVDCDTGITTTATVYAGTSDNTGTVKTETKYYAIVSADDWCADATRKAEFATACSTYATPAPSTNNGGSSSTSTTTRKPTTTTPEDKDDDGDNAASVAVAGAAAALLALSFRM